MTHNSLTPMMLINAKFPKPDFYCKNTEHKSVLDKESDIMVHVQKEHFRPDEHMIK